MTLRSEHEHEGCPHDCALCGVLTEAVLSGLRAEGAHKLLSREDIQDWIASLPGSEGSCIDCSGPLVTCTCRPDCPEGMCARGCDVNKKSRVALGYGAWPRDHEGDT